MKFASLPQPLAVECHTFKDALPDYGVTAKLWEWRYMCSGYPPLATGYQRSNQSADANDFPLH